MFSSSASLLTLFTTPFSTSSVFLKWCFLQCLRKWRVGSQVSGAAVFHALLLEWRSCPEP